MACRHCNKSLYNIHFKQYRFRMVEWDSWRFSVLLFLFCACHWNDLIIRDFRRHLYTTNIHTNTSNIELTMAKCVHFTWFDFNWMSQFRHFWWLQEWLTIVSCYSKSIFDQSLRCMYLIWLANIVSVENMFGLNMFVVVYKQDAFSVKGTLLTSFNSGRI